MIIIRLIHVSCVVWMQAMSNRQPYECGLPKLYNGGDCECDIWCAFQRIPHLSSRFFWQISQLHLRKWKRWVLCLVTEWTERKKRDFTPCLRGERAAKQMSVMSNSAKDLVWIDVCFPFLNRVQAGRHVSRILFWVAQGRMCHVSIRYQRSLSRLWMP